MKLITFLMFMVVGHVAFSQTIKFEPKSLSVEKADEPLIVPLTVKVDNNKTPGQHVSIALVAGDRANISFESTDKLLNKANEATFYLILAKDYPISAAPNVQVRVSLVGVTASDLADITVKVAPVFTYTLNDYSNDPKLILDYVTKVESTDNILTVYGYHKTNSEIVVKRKISLKQNQKYGIFNTDLRLLRPGLSLLTVPFKIRPKQDDLKATAQSGITNLGLNLDFVRLNWDTYSSDASKKSQKLSLGAWLAPSVEELDSATTNGFLTGANKSKQIFLSTGLTISYSFNAISFVVVPVGFDLPMSEVGRKWVYKGRYWWGFGIAIEPKALAAILNK